MKKEKERCKDCAEYGSEFCPNCLDKQTKQAQTDAPAADKSKNKSS